MKKLVYIPLIIFSLGVISLAQDVKAAAGKTDCGKIELQGPPSAIRSAETATFTVNVFKNDEDEKYPIIKWSLDKGTILSGQGTSSIEVGTDGLYAEVLTVYLKVLKSADCVLTTSGTAEIAGGHPWLFDEIEKADEKEIIRRFGLYIKELNETPTDGYIINYGTKPQVSKREKVLRSLMAKNNIPDEKIVFVYGGEEEQIKTRFWFVPDGCPRVSLANSPSSVKSGDKLKVTLNIFGGKYDKNKIKIDWLAEGGEIVSGQGERKVEILASKQNTVELIVKATAKVSGFPKGCKDVEISETYYCSHCGEIGTAPKLVDEFGDLSQGDIKARLDVFIIENLNNQYSQGYILNYGSPKQVAIRERVIRKHLKSRNFDMQRIVFKYVRGEDGIRTRFWLVPPGADASTID